MCAKGYEIIFYFITTIFISMFSLCKKSVEECYALLVCIHKNIWKKTNLLDRLLPYCWSPQARENVFAL